MTIYIVISVYCRIEFIVCIIIGFILFLCVSYNFFRTEFIDPGRIPYIPELYNESKISKRPMENILL